jgi:hypothetical protein
MRKIIAALALTSITAPAWADAIETIEARTAADFFLSTCLPAMDDVTNVEKMAQENNWPRIPGGGAADSKYTTAHSKWRANGIFVTTWTFKAGNAPSCFIGFAPYKRVNREEFLEIISTCLPLKLTSEIALQQGHRTQTYRVTGKGLLLMFGSRDNDATTVSIWKDVDDKQ